MSIFTLADTIGDLKRFRDIASIIYEEGFPFLLEKAQLKWVVRIECRIRCFLKACIGMRQLQKKDFPVRLRILLTKLGPTFVKLGQVMSLRQDLLPDDICKELSKLTNEVPAIPYQEAKKVVEEELKQPLVKKFAHFDKEPLAAASLAQVYKAVLPDGTKVAVKIQRPGIKNLIEKDIHIMLYLAKVIEEKVPEWKVYRPISVVKEFADTIARELDFTVEAIHAKRFAQMFTEDKSVKVAQVYNDYSAKRVLTMELITGIKADDLEGLKEAKINKQILAENGVNAFLRQVFVEGFFHADPHPGNYFALPGNIFAFIDYGMVGRLNTHDRRELASLFMSFINKDSESAIEHIKHLVEVTDTSNLSSFEHDIDDILNQWYDAKLREVSLAQAFFKIIESGRKNQIYFPSSLVFLGKTLFTIEAMGFKLDPDFDFAKQMSPFVKKILKEELNPKKLAQKVEDRALDYISYVETLPEMTVKLMKKIDQGEIGIKIDSEELKELERRLSWEGYKKLATTIIAAGLFAFGAAYLVENKLVNLHVSVTTFGIIFLVLILLWILRR